MSVNSKQTYVRLPDKVRDQLKAYADEDQVTFTQVLIDAAKFYIANREKQS